VNEVQVIDSGDGRALPALAASFPAVVSSVFGSLKELTGEEIAPGAHLSSDDELLKWVRNNAETTYHPVGTCKMGADPRAVVDHELRVHGLGGLRVADASIMPTLTSGNTNAPCIMIGEKCAEMVLAAATVRDRRVAA